MKKILALVALFLVAGCNTPCSSPSSVASILANAAVNDWQCTNPTQVQADIAAAASGFGLCSLPASAARKVPLKTGAIANVACPLVIGELQSVAAGRIPASWGCNSSLVGVNGVAALTAICEQLPF